VSEAGGLGDKTIVTLTSITLVVFLGGENISSAIYSIYCSALSVDTLRVCDAHGSLNAKGSHPVPEILA
jgi:hypothetical protein